MFEQVMAARRRLAGQAHVTPVMTSATFNARVGAEVIFKCENFQRAGAFKFRGAYNAAACLPESERRNGLVTFSSGNHAQALALVGRLWGVPVTVVMPQDGHRWPNSTTNVQGGKPNCRWVPWPEGSGRNMAATSNGPSRPTATATAHVRSRWVSRICLGCFVSVTLAD